MHDHVHGPLLVDRRLGLGAPEEGQGPKVAFRLRDQGRIVAVADREKQFARDDRLARVDVDAVGRPIEQFIFGRRFRIEDVIGLDLDRGDDASGRRAKRRARLRRQRRRMQEKERGQRASATRGKETAYLRGFDLDRTITLLLARVPLSSVDRFVTPGTRGLISFLESHRTAMG
jgi:hypothetical protein